MLNATKVELCPLSVDGSEEVARITLPKRAGPVWHGNAPGLQPGALYGYRVHVAYQPDRGHRFNPAKLLVDPYARAFHDDWTSLDQALGHAPDTPDNQDRPCQIDSAPFVPKSIVPDIETPWAGAPSPRRPWSETMIY